MSISHFLQQRYHAWWSHPRAYSRLCCFEKYSRIQPSVPMWSWTKRQVTEPSSTPELCSSSQLSRTERPQYRCPQQRSKPCSHALQEQSRTTTQDLFRSISGLWCIQKCHHAISNTPMSHMVMGVLFLLVYGSNLICRVYDQVKLIWIYKVPTKTESSILIFINYVTKMQEGSKTHKYSVRPQPDWVDDTSARHTNENPE